ncbi:helix-turn-helix domain-containing protein [Serratia sp. (in: enterobacteria)]|uniref:helix-turn-helix domain-containing protein n=1 Tax=Serratia sp. (in: enterobacteria) TaxID=616 RepID=UPI003988F28D
MYDFSKVIEKHVPQAEIDEMFTSIESFSPARKGKPGQRFYLDQSDKRMCFLLYSGTCTIKRNSDSLILSTLRAHSIVGLQDIFHDKSDVQIIANSEIEYRLLSVDELFLHVEDKHLWKNICYMLMLSATRFSEYQKETVGVSNYELICNLLTSLSMESFEIRATTTALEYVQERSLLSRSGIMKTLSSLKAGGYVIIKKGLLIRINSLPKKF